MAERKKSLEVRLANIESKLSELTRFIGPKLPETKASKEDIDTYLRVLRASMAADWGEFCGINDCMRCIGACVTCYRCTVCAGCIRCYPCYECTCGPCIGPGPLKQGARVFESLG